jgi:hypothetical protein
LRAGNGDLVQGKRAAAGGLARDEAAGKGDGVTGNGVATVLNVDCVEQRTGAEVVHAGLVGARDWEDQVVAGSGRSAAEPVGARAPVGAAAADPEVGGEHDAGFEDFDSIGIEAGLHQDLTLPRHAGAAFIAALAMRLRELTVRRRELAVTQHRHVTPPAR